MESLAALSLAGTIVNFLDFFGALLSTGYAAYRGFNHETCRLETVYNDLKGLSTKLSNADRAVGFQLSEDERQLNVLAKEAQELAKKLLKELEPWKSNQKRLIEAWHAVRREVRLFVKSEKIKGMQDDLEKIRSGLITRLLNIVRNNQSGLQIDLDRLVEECRRNESAGILRLSEAKQDLHHAIEQLDNRVKASQVSCESALEANTLAIVSIQDSLKILTEKLDKMKEACDATHISQKILSSLLYPEIHSRERKIMDAYTHTYEWIFNGVFGQWLESDSKDELQSIFWLHGKAGSGKSTLMKFIVGHSRTEELLEQWANDKRLVIGSFYFWNAGTEMQKSQAGLWQSMLFQLLRDFPELIPDVCPRRWKAASRFHLNAWSRTELFSAVHSALNSHYLADVARFVFFIDGLDEYEDEEQDTHSLVRLIRQLARSPIVKVCASGRPRKVFSNNFSSLRFKQVALEQLTERDIQHFILSELEQDDRFQNRLEDDPEVDHLVSKIQDRADGVFLWVFLAVKSLLRGLTESDDIDKLLERLALLPADLRTYFDHMLSNLDEVYRLETARVLLLVANSDGLLPVGPLCFLTEDIRDDQFAFAAWKTLNRAQLEHMQLEIISRISSWCPDLLEFRHSDTTGGGPLEWTVHCLHLTVLDFLKERKVQLQLYHNAGWDSSPWFNLCRMNLAYVKMLDNDVALQRSASRFTLDESAFFLRYVTACLQCARLCELSENYAPVEILDELDEYCHRWSAWTSQLIFSLGMWESRDHQTDLPNLSEGIQFRHWTTKALIQEIASPLLFRQSNFLTLAAHFRLELYLQAKLEHLGHRYMQSLITSLWECCTDDFYVTCHVETESKALLGTMHLLEAKGIDFSKALKGRRDELTGLRLDLLPDTSKSDEKVLQWLAGLLALNDIQALPGSRLSLAAFEQHSFDITDFGLPPKEYRRSNIVPNYHSATDSPDSSSSEGSQTGSRTESEAESHRT